VSGRTDFAEASDFKGNLLGRFLTYTLVYCFLESTPPERSFLDLKACTVTFSPEMIIPLICSIAC
jgi:hypothetical protein